jgi:hypothetical protein
MASHPISHENLEPGSSCSPADVDTIAALKISTIGQVHEVLVCASPQRIPFQPVPSNLGVIMSGSPIQAGGVTNSPATLREADGSGPSGVTPGRSAGKDSSTLLETQAAECATDSVGQLSSPENEVRKSSLMNNAAIGPSNKQIGSGTVNEVSGEGLGRAQRILLTPHEVQGQEADSKVQGRALGAGARRVEHGTKEGSTEENVGSKEAVKKEPPLAWFPRAKKDSFLERKIKKMQASNMCPLQNDLPTCSGSAIWRIVCSFEKRTGSTTIIIILERQLAKMPGGQCGRRLIFVALKQTCSATSRGPCELTINSLLIQESEGPKEHLGEAFVKKMSRVEREKAAAAAAAEAALAAKKAALVEVSWCRILEAAG